MFEQQPYSEGHLGLDCSGGQWCVAGFSINVLLMFRINVLFSYFCEVTQ